MPKIVAEHYEQGRAIYQAGHDLRELMANADAMDTRRQAEHDAVEANLDPNVDKSSEIGEKHFVIDDRYRGAEQSLILGFADCFLADIRRAVQPRGQRA